MTQAARRDRPVTRDDVVETALRLVEEHDVSALTMRRLAAELGTAVTSIYWHVGNRDALLDLLVERLLEDMETVRPTGRTPRARVTAVLSQWRVRLLERPHLIGFAHERGQTGALFQPMQAALARELAALGLSGSRAARIIRTLQVHVSASVVLERTASRGPATLPTDATAWGEDPSDPDLVAALTQPIDYGAAFATGVDALLDHLLPS